MRARHLVSKTSILDAWQRVRAAVRHGCFVGLAFNAAYLLSWLLIAPTGSPGDTFWVMLGLVVQALALAAAISVVMQGDGANWRNRPIPVLVAPFRMGIGGYDSARMRSRALARAPVAAPRAS
jgi:hypothetical protein